VIRDDRPRANPRSVPDERLMPSGERAPTPSPRIGTTFRLLLRFAAEQKGKRPCELDFSDLDAALIGAFLEHLEVCGTTASAPATTACSGDPLPVRLLSSPPPRTCRTTACPRHPDQLTDRKLVTYLNDDEVDALLGACDLGTWAGRRTGAARPRVEAGRASPNLPRQALGRNPRQRRKPPRDRGKAANSDRSPSLKGRQVATSLAGRDRRRLRWPAAPDKPPAAI